MKKITYLFAFCFSIFSFQLSAQDLLITGQITCVNGNPLPDISVYLSAPGIPAIEVKTDEMGFYKFWQLEEGFIYEVSPSYADEEPLNGITGDDKNMIHNHILGIALLDMPFQMLSADIDLSGTVTLTDMVLLQDAILGISEDSMVDNWRFATEDFQFPSPSLPNGAGFVDAAVVTITQNIPPINFIGVKFGDADTSVCP